MATPEKSVNPKRKEPENNMPPSNTGKKPKDSYECSVCEREIVEDKDENEG